MPGTSATHSKDQLGAVVLCGGRSQRMGFDKASLPFGENTFLDEVIKHVEPAVGKIVLVGNSQQNLESFPVHTSNERIAITFDEQNGFGPLEGIRAGLKILSHRFNYAFVTSCDVPLLCTDLIPFLFSKIDKHEALIPVDTSLNRVYGLTAIYHTALHSSIAKLIDNNDLRVSDLATHFDTKLIDMNELKAVDPELNSFLNINCLDDYRRLLECQLLKIPAQFRETE